MSRNLFNFSLLLALLSVFPAFGQTNGNDTTALQDTTALFKELEEVVVEGQTVRHKGNQDEYVVTKQMREGTRDAGDLIGKIPGVFYNRISKSIKYQGSDNVKILVDSLERDEEYIKRLGSKRFDKIYVINNPVGQYAGYDAVISLHTKPLYEGYEGNIVGDVYARTGSRNGDGKNLYNARGNGDFTYTREKWNFAVMGGYTWSRPNNRFNTDEEYPLNDYKLTEIPGEGNQPNTWRTNRTAKLNISADYSFNSNHVLSLAINSNFNNNSIISARNMHAEWSDRSMDFARKDWNNTKRNLSVSEVLQYLGTLGAWHTTFSAGLNQIAYKRDYGIWQSNGYSLTDNRDIRIDYGWANGSGWAYVGNNKFYLSVYDYLIWSHYRENRAEDSRLLSKSSDIRNNMGASFGYFPSNTFSAGVSAGIQFIKSSFSGISQSKVSPSFGGWLAWYPSKKAVVRLNYNLFSNPAALSQVQEYGQFTDSLMWHSGNPLLKPVMNHSLTGSLMLWNSLSLRATFQQDNHAIFDIATPGYGLRPDGETGYYAKYQYENGRSRLWTVSLTFNRNLGTHWQIGASAGLRGMYGSWKEYTLNKTMFEEDWHVMYFTSGQSWGFFLSGHLTPQLYVSPQEKMWAYEDGYAITIQKNLLKGNLEIYGMWWLPLHFASGDRVSNFNSESVIIRGLSNNQFRDDNMLRLMVIYKFNGGERTRKQNVSNYNIEL